MLNQLYPERTLEQLTDREFQVYVWLLSYFMQAEEHQVCDMRVAENLIRELSLDDKKRINPNFIPDENEIETLAKFFPIDEKARQTTVYNILRGIDVGWDYYSPKWDNDNLLEILHEALQDTPFYIDLTRKDTNDANACNPLYYMLDNGLDQKSSQVIIEIFQKMIKQKEFDINATTPVFDEFKTYAEAFLEYMPSKEYLKMLEVSLNSTPKEIELDTFISFIRLFYEKLEDFEKLTEISVVSRYIAASLSIENLMIIIKAIFLITEGREDTSLPINSKEIFKHLHVEIEKMKFLLTIFTEALRIKMYNMLRKGNTSNSMPIEIEIEIDRDIDRDNVFQTLSRFVNVLLEMPVNCPPIIEFLNNLIEPIIQYLSNLASSAEILNNNNTEDKANDASQEQFEQFEQFRKVLLTLLQTVCGNHPAAMLEKSPSIRYDLFMPIVNFIFGNLENSPINTYICRAMIEANFTLEPHILAQIKNDKQERFSSYLLISPYLSEKERTMHYIGLTKEIDKKDQEINGLKKINDKKDQIIGDLEEEIGDFKEEINELKEEINKLKKEINESKKRKNDESNAFKGNNWFGQDSHPPEKKLRRSKSF